MCHLSIHSSAMCCSILGLLQHNYTLIAMHLFMVHAFFSWVSYSDPQLPRISVTSIASREVLFVPKLGTTHFGSFWRDKMKKLNGKRGLSNKNSKKQIGIIIKTHRNTRIYSGSACCLRPLWSWLLYWCFFDDYNWFQWVTADNNDLQQWNSLVAAAMEFRTGSGRVWALENSKKKPLFCMPWGSIYRCRRLVFRSELGRPSLARDQARTPKPMKFRSDPWSTRADFDSLKI